jgi:DMSO/TMAO reductase YedYZ molybdopterin-dependent catalytic subunit
MPYVTETRSTSRSHLLKKHPLMRLLFISFLAATVGAVAAWAQVEAAPPMSGVLGKIETVTFRSNGTDNPDDDDYQRHARTQFRDWKLRVDGLVRTPTELSLAQLRAMKSRTQITRHDCVEGWSAIAKWTGVPFSEILGVVGPAGAVRYAVFHCADPMDDGGTRYYESIGLDDAHHPQTILAYELNGKPLPVANGAPVRARIERQLGYKMAKYIMRIELVESLKHIGGGRGGYWEDQGYEWYAGT